MDKEFIEELIDLLEVGGSVCDNESICGYDKKRFNDAIEKLKFNL